MVAAIIVGILVGLIGFAPYFIVTKKARSLAANGNPGYLKWLLITFFISFVILVIAIIVCSKVAHDVALPFAAAMMITFIVVVIVFGFANREKK